MRDENSNFPQARSHASPAREIELKLEVPLRSLGRERLEAAGERTCQGRQCPSSPRHDPVGIATSPIERCETNRSRCAESERAAAFAVTGWGRRERLAAGPSWSTAMTHTSAKSAARRGARKHQASLYEEITTKIMAELEAGRVPWVQPWGSSAVCAPLAIPKNAATSRAYSGINVLILWGAVVESGFATQSWLTFRQALTLGAHVRKGERGTTVVYADRFIPDKAREPPQDADKQVRAIPFLKRFTVFNIEQCEDLPESVTGPTPPVESDLILPQAETLLRANGIDLRIGGDRAYYDVASDFIRVPPPQAFFEPINWHRTALHEFGPLVWRCPSARTRPFGFVRLEEIRTRGTRRRARCRVLVRVARHCANSSARGLCRLLA